MKRTIAILLVFVLALCCYGCSSKEAVYRSPVTFYYCVKDIDYSENATVIHSEDRIVNLPSSNLKGILQSYLEGPKNRDLYSPFPDDLAVVELSVDADTTYITFNTNLSYLTGIDLTLACICIANTCFNLTHTQNVDISAEHALLDNAPSILIGNSSTLTTDLH